MVATLRLKIRNNKRLMQPSNTNIRNITWDKQTKGLYRQHINTITNEDRDRDMTWTDIMKVCEEAANKLQPKTNGKTKNNDIQTLSDRQKNIRNQMNTTKNQDTRQKLNDKRKRTLKQLHKTIQATKERELNDQLHDIEKYKDNPSKMFRAIQTITKTKKEPLTIQDENGLTADSEKVTEIITQHFKGQFHTNAHQPLPDITPTPLENPFTLQEIQNAIKRLQNNKSAGPDNIYAEQLKYAPDYIHAQLQNILNDIAATGTYPDEIKHGLLVPLQKPGKPKGPPENLRPIILLSMLRKILAICLLKRIKDKIDRHIPATQAAYRQGRNTTEHVLAIKLLCDKAMTSTDYQTHILLLDMSKAFDTVDRLKLYHILETKINKDELNLANTLLKDVTIQIKNDNSLGQTFTTNIGIPQGDSASAFFFITYLSEALKNSSTTQQRETQTVVDRNTRQRPKRNINRPAYLSDYITEDNKLTDKRDYQQDQQFADDIGYASNNLTYIDSKKDTIPKQLEEYNLTVNLQKTEQHKVHRQGPEDWKDCKYLGSLLDTRKDIDRRRRLANFAFHTHRNILTSQRLSLKTRLRAFDAYITPIYLYNADLWTLTKTMADKVDCHHRQYLRRIMKVHWPRTITNIRLYNITQQTAWTTKLKASRLRLTGHILRLPEDTPVRQALSEALKPTRRPPGRPRLTWVAQVARDLEGMGLPGLGEEELLDLASDRDWWREMVRGVNGAKLNEGSDCAPIGLDWNVSQGVC